MMENIELWIIGILFSATLISLIALKESRHFAKYWKDLYFIQKDLNDKLKKVSEGNQLQSKDGKLPLQNDITLREQLNIFLNWEDSLNGIKNNQKENYKYIDEFLRTISSR